MDKKRGRISPNGRSLAFKNEKQSQAQSRRRGFSVRDRFRTTGRMCDRPGRRAAAGAGVAAFYQLATGPASAALAGARLREDQGKENRLQSKRPGAVCLQILVEERSPRIGDPAPAFRPTQRSSSPVLFFPTAKNRRFKSLSNPYGRSTDMGFPARARAAYSTISSGQRPRTSCCLSHELLVGLASFSLKMIPPASMSSIDIRKYPARELPVSA